MISDDSRDSDLTDPQKPPGDTRDWEEILAEAHPLVREYIAMLKRRIVDLEVENSRLNPLRTWPSKATGDLTPPPQSPVPEHKPDRLVEIRKKYRISRMGSFGNRDDLQDETDVIVFVEFEPGWEPQSRSLDELESDLFDIFHRHIHVRRF